jgi:hypothetical protein
VYKGCFDVINVSVNGASTILSLPHAAINGLHSPSLSKRMYMSALLPKNQMIRSLPDPKNERQCSVNDCWHCVMKYPVGCVLTVSHDRTIGCLSIEQWWWQHFYHVLTMSVNRVSTTLSLAS